MNKWNRQQEANVDVSEASTESYEEASVSTGTRCPHIAKAINLNRLKKSIKRTSIINKCSMCNKLEADSTNADEEVRDVSKPLWVCLQCGEQNCGKEHRQHSVEHFQKPHSDCHCIMTNIHYWSVWCYQCDIEICPSSRKKLLETVEFLKKIVSMPHIPQQPVKKAVNKFQKEMIVNVKDQEKRKVLNNFPKVGGLTNLGNTCFFNAVLQCLAQTPYLVKVLEDLRQPEQQFILPGGKHKLNDTEQEEELPPIKGTLDQSGSFTSILSETLVKMQNTNGQTYTPTNLLSELRKKTTQCMDGGQHDSHEFLRHLLEIVRNEDLRRYQSVILREIGLSEKTNPEGVEKALKFRVKFYGNQASKRLLGPQAVFRGILMSTLECLDCHHSSQRTEQFLDLSLPVTPDKPQPPIMKRKNGGFEDSFESQQHEWPSLQASSWRQVRKEKKAARKNRKNKRHEIHNNVNISVEPSNPVEENNDSALKSGIAIFTSAATCSPDATDVKKLPMTQLRFAFCDTQCSTKKKESDADVEDNIEVDNFHPEVGESGYSSEKASAVASPISPADHLSNNDLNSDVSSTTNLIEDNNLDSNFDSTQVRPVNINALTSPSPTDVSMTDLTQIRVPPEKTDRNIGTVSSENEASATALSTSMIVNSDITSPEAPTASLSSSGASKESPTSPVNGYEVAERLDSVETWMEATLPKCNRRKYNNGISNCEEPEEQDLCNSGIGDMMTGMSRLGISGHQSPSRYSTKEGECSVESCLNQFTSPELMTGSNKVVCEACTARERKGQESPSKMVCTSSSKQYLISQVPPVLILHMKRFQTQNVGFRKVSKQVSFPLLLDLAPVCKDHKKPRLYALYGIVEHSGNVHGGHYVAYVKTRLPLSADDPRWDFLPKYMPDDSASNSSSSDSEGKEASAKLTSILEPPPGRWYYISDSRVSEVDESTVLQSQAYLLFYERIL